MGTDTGSGMRGFVQILTFAFLAAGYGQAANAGANGSLVYAAGGNLVRGNLIPRDALSCEQPLASDDFNAELPVATEVHPIWHVDLDTVYLGYIEDGYAGDAAAAGSLSGIEVDQDDYVPEGGMGLQLDSGWSLALSYELMDARFKVGPFLVPEAGQPVFEGPKFVATLKFR